MADSNLNPAPRNVSAINGAQGVDLSGVGQYDENTPLEDIAASYTNTGKQLGQIISQAAEHVGDIQTKLIGNDFGGTNPYMYNTYYEPGANEIQSSWRAAGEQKAFEVGLERGKKAAEDAAKAAQNNYNDAVNNFNQAVANPTIATVDTSLLGEGNTLSELDKTGNFAGTKEHAQNTNIDNAINKFGVSWDDKSDTWSNAVKATMQNAGVSQETYDSWTPEQRQSFWDDDANSVYFRNHYAEEDIRKSLGEEGLKNYQSVFQNTIDEINKVYDYLNGVTDKLELDPVKIFEYTAADITKTSRWSDLAEFWKGNYHDVNLWTIRYNDLVKEGGWIDQNIKEEYREDVRKFIDDTSREVDYTLNDLDWRLPAANHKIYDDEALDKLQDFAQGKLTETAESIYGNKIESKQEVKELSPEAGLQSIIGIDMDTLRWYKSMKDEHPEVLDTIKNQIAQAYGETNALEIADGEHYYLINGKYEKPEAGTVVLFAMPGVMDNEGNFNNKDYETFVDCFKKLNNAAANYSKEEREKLQETMQNAWTKYYQSIYLMKIGEAYTGSTADEDMYRSVMYRVDPSKYENLVVNGKPAKEIVGEWKTLADKDGHKAYVQLGQLLNRAYSNLGFYYGMDQNGNLVEYNLDLADTGEKTVGQVMGNDENPYKDLTPAQAMAIYNVVTTSLQEYQRGNNQDKNINPYFLDDDNADWPQEFANSAWNMFGWMVDVPVLLLNMGATGIGNIGLNEPIDPANEQYVTGTGALAGLWPGNWGRDDLDENFATQSWNEYWNGSPKKGTLNYFVQVSDLQQQNLADAINPYMIEYWFGEEGSTADIKRIGEGYTSRTKPVLELGPLRNFDVYGLNTMFANGTSFKEASAKLLGAIAGGMAAGKIGSAYSSALMKGVSRVSENANMLATNIRVEIAAHGIEKAIKNTTTEQIAQGTLENTMLQTFAQQATKSDWGGVAALPASTTGALSKGNSDIMVNSSKNFVMRGMTDAALDTSGPVIEGFSTEFLEKSFSTAETSAALKSAGFTAQEAKTIINSVEENAKLASKAIAQETLAATTLSLGTGLPAEAFAAMNASTQNLFMKAYNAVLRGATTAKEFGTGSISAFDFLQSIGVEGIKEAAVKVAEESAAAAARGMKWTNSDTFRVLSGLGWEGGATRALYAELANDAIMDMFRDNMRNNSVAYLSNEGWERQSVEDYFMNPWTYIQNGIFTGIQFGKQRIGAQIKDAWYSKKYNEHLKAYSASGDAQDVKAAELAKVNEYIDKIQRNNNMLMRRGVSYANLKNSSEKINDDLNYVIFKQYENSGINPVTGEMEKKFTTADEFNDYLTTKKLSTKDRINLANRGLVIETQNNFFVSRYELGGSDQTKLGNIKDWQINWDMQDIEQRTLDKYYDEVIHMKGSPMDKQRRMYSLYTQEIMAKYGKAIPGLEAALNNYYGHYLSDMEAALKANPKAQWTLGYTSLAGMTTLSDDSGDVMFGASFGNNFNTVDRNAADVDKSRAYRDIKRQLLDAIKRGDTELTITRADGKEKTYHLNKDGLNYLKTITAYNNANTVHKYYDPIFGDSVQTHEHKDQVPFAEAAYRATDAIISSTKVATQAAEADAKAAQEVIAHYTELAYSRYKGTAEDSIMAERNKKIVEANTALNVSDSDKIYKLSQDRAAAERYVQELDERKHGELQRRYKEVVPMLAEIDGEIGKIEAQREYRQAVSNTKTAINMYLEGKLSEDNPIFTYKYGENESIKITLDDETIDAIAEAARNGQEFNSDLTMSMMVAKRNAVPKRVKAVDEATSNKDYTNIIKDLEADTARTGDDHTASIIKLRQEMKKNNIRHHENRAKTSGGGNAKNAVEYGYKAIQGTDLDTATTGFKIDGKDQLVKNAADDYYYLPQAGKKANPRRAQIVEAATAPLRDFLAEQNGGLDKYDERMIAYVANAAEQNLRNIDTGEENLRITVGTLKREIMKVAPDAEIWLAAKNSGAIERISTLSSRGAQPAAMMEELKVIMASHSDMPETMRNKFIDTIELYSLMSENSNSIKANAFSLDKIVGEGDNETTMGDLMQDAQTLVSATRNLEKYEKTELKRMASSAGDVLKRISNPNSKYSSALIKKLSSDLSSSSNIAKAVKKDFRTTAFDYYKQAVKAPTPNNQGFVDAAFTWAKARYEADPRAARIDGKLDLSKVKVNEIDCMNVLGVANHEVMLSPFGDKDNHTYAQYMAAQNNVRDFDLESTNGIYSEQAKDYIMLGNATYGQGIEQAERGIDQLIRYFPEAKGDLLKKKENYSLEGRRVSAQYATTNQLRNRIQNIDNATLEEYGLGKLKFNDLSRAASLAGRLSKAKAEQELLANRPISETWLGISPEGRAADLSVTPWRTRYDANGEEDTGATIASFRNATRMMNEPTSIAGEIEPGVTAKDYDAIVTKARKDLTALYKEAGLADGRKGRIPAAEIDEFGQKILDSYKNITDNNGSGLANDLLTLSSARNDNAENALISVMSQAYDESARTTYDAQTNILENRAKDLKRRISKLPKTGKSYVTPVVAEPTTEFPLRRIISGAQTGVDTIGLEVGKELGYETGGTTTPGYYREKGIDNHTPESLKALGVEEITTDLQGGKRGKEFFLPRTEQNVKNSDGTVYFASDEDSAGKIATERFAKANKKPFLLNPSADELKSWIQKNNIETLNVAGNRGSKIGDMKEGVINTLKTALAKQDSTGTSGSSTTVASVFDRDIKVVNTNGGFKTNHPNGGRSWLRNTPDGYLLDVDAMHNAFGRRTWRNPQRSEKLNVDFDTEEDMLAFGLLHERGHDFLGTKATASEAKDFETKVNNWAEEHYTKNTPEYKAAKRAARNILRQVLSPADLLKRQLSETESALQRHQALDSDAMVRDGKMQFYTDQQVLSGEFGRQDINIKETYRNNNYPSGLEIGEGKILYTVDPDQDGADIMKTGKNEVSARKLKQYLFDKASDVRNRFGEYYEGFELNSKNFEDNGDGTYTITGKYGYGDMDLHEQEALQISRWENMDMSDINAEKRAILELSTTPIYESYDKMIDINRYKSLINKKADLSSELEDKDAIVTINALRKAAYDQYLQLTYELGKEFLDSEKVSKKYHSAMAEERKAFKIDNMDEQTVKSNLSRDEYNKYIEAKETLFNVAKFQLSSDSGIYQAKNGVIFAKDGYNPTGFVDTNIAKAILEGRAIDTTNMSDEDIKAALNTEENRAARKEMQKGINKNQNKGSVHYKNTEEYKAIKNSAMDKLSARYTLNNYIEFENQTRDMLTGMGLADEYKILMEKDYSDMMQRVAGKDGGIENDGVKAKFFDLMMHTANLNKTIQDWQLAGGFSNYNAATIAQIRGAIFNDPRMALEYLKVFTAAKNSNSTMEFVAQNREFLYRFVAKTGAGEYITDLNQAISTAPGQGDVGTINSLTNRVLSHLDGSREVEGKNKISRGFGRLSDDMNAVFSDATFVNTFPLFKVRMLQINYDEALRYLKKFKGYDKMSANDVDDAAMWMAYAKTTDFLEPRKTRGSSWDEFRKNIANEELRKAAASWTGAKRDASLMDNASTVFFALRWKMTFGGRILNGLTNTPGALIRKMRLRNADITDTDTLAMAGKQFMRSGNTTGVGVMIALSALAMMWNKNLGYDSVSWDDLNIIGEDGEFQVPNILKKFQTLGQFWLPNAQDENGAATIDPTKRMYGLDPFSSMFTMSNTVARTFDRLVNPNAYQKTPQRGIIFSHSSNDAINGFINSPIFQAIGDELIGANLLSPYKAMYEVLVDDTYFGNNIWEKRKLADGTDNPNYDPLRNVVAGFAHILNWDWLLSGGTNRWVKGFGSDKYQNSGKIGTVAGSGVFQHEFITAAFNIMNGEALEGIVEAGELPIKTKNISGSARTDFNVRVKNIITQYVQEYKDKVGDMNNLDAKDAEYANLVKKCADVVAAWSAKNEYVLGKDQELVAYVTKTLMAICAGEYNDNLDYVQNAYWKAQDIAQIEQSEDLFLGDPDLERYIAEGKSVEEFAEEKNRRSEAYNQAIDDEYQARVALKEAGLPDSYLAAYEDKYGNKDKNDFKTLMRAVNKQVFAEVHGVLEGKIGEFKNFKEMKQYYEAQIEAATTTKQKAKLADKYNDILTDAITPYVNKYGAAILSDGYYNNQNLANSIAEYVILPADKYYYGKTPRASYLRDLFHVGYRDNSAMPSDKEVYEKYTSAMAKIHEGASASAAAMLDRLITDYKAGRLYISDYDYSRIIRMKAQLNARSKQ